MERRNSGTGAPWDGGTMGQGRHGTGRQLERGALGRGRGGDWTGAPWDGGTIGQGRNGTEAHRDGPAISMPVVVGMWKKIVICVGSRLYRIDDNTVLSDHKFRLVAVRLNADFNVCLQ